MHKIKRMQSFSYRDKGTDKGNGVRDKAKAVCELLENSEQLAEERTKSQQIRTKLSGMATKGSIRVKG